MATLRMYQGEKRKLYMSVKSEDDLPFKITSARYEFWNCDTDEKEAEGECDIDDHTLGVVVCPAQPGIYKVKYILKIAEETVIRRTIIRVSET